MKDRRAVVVGQKGIEVLLPVMEAVGDSVAEITENTFYGKVVDSRGLSVVLQ